MAPQSVCVVTGADADLTGRRLDKLKVPVPFECALTDVCPNSMQHSSVMSNHRNICQRISEHLLQQIDVDVYSSG